MLNSKRARRGRAGPLGRACGTDVGTRAGMHLVKLVVVATSCLAVRSAAAQPEPPIDRTQSVLPTLLPTSSGATIDGRLDYVRLTDSSSAPTLFALKLHGQYVAPQGIGGYLSLPLVYASSDGNSDTYVGNLELGGLYVLRRPDFDVYARAGATLELGGDEAAFVVPIVNLSPHPADAITTGLGTSWLRAGGGIRFTSGALVAGLSGGIDSALDSEGLDNLLNLTGVIGLVQPGFGLAVGLTLVQLLDDSDGDNSLVGLQLIGDVEVAAKVRLYGALGINLEDESEGFSLGAGVRAGF
jgi:hypothetical protein